MNLDAPNDDDEPKYDAWRFAIKPPILADDGLIFG